MKTQINKVRAFHNAFKQENGVTPSNTEQNVFELRHRLMSEENDEYLEACKNNDLIGIADALGDQLYILCGTILKHGLQNKIEDVFTEIHESNLSKLDDNGKPIFREDGKILKSNNYFKPDLSKFIKI